MKPRVGILGYETGGKTHYSELRRSVKFEICGVYDSSPIDSYCRAEIFTNFKNFIQQGTPTAIIISLKENEIFEAFCECIKYCQNILIEFPICKNADELSQMKYLAHKHGAKVALSFISRFNPAVVSLKKELKKEEEIYSIDIFHSCLKQDANIINELTLCDIDLVKLISNSDIADINTTFVNRTNSKSSDNALIKIKFKNQILGSIINSLTGSLDRHFMNVSAKSGVYFCDLITGKLHKVSNDGQINLKVNSDENELKMLHDEFYNLIQNGEYNNLAILDDAIKIHGLLQ